MPTQRTVFGGRVRHGKPVVTMTFIALCLLVYVVDRVAPGVRSTLWFVPAFGETEPYRFLTAAFLHGGFLHLAVNMYALWIVGSVLEPALGRWRYTALFLLSSLGGSVGVLLLASPAAASWMTAVVGASGAVFGLFAAIGLVLRRLGRDATQILVLLVINAVLGFVIAGIAWQAHLGGFITGGLLTAAFVYAPKGRRTIVAVAASVVVLVVLIVLAVLKYATV
ncbi:rhomboid family intramembrane serine protease [Georgenia sunbinii]|uniref:rhomboid family intramembrane serine protease n=1 Tax=Georgenia sunbinii TaxID=3117728 RepID=UPI002F25EDBB